MSKQKPVDPLRETVKLLDKTTRVMQSLSGRLDVLAFGQRQIERRLYVLEQAARKAERHAKRKAPR